MRVLIPLIALLSTGVVLAKDAGVASPGSQDAGASATARAPLGPGRGGRAAPAGSAPSTTATPSS